MVLIVDYGMGNIRSVEKAFKRLETDVVFSMDPNEIRNAAKILLPGVGHFKKGMANLEERGLIEPLKEAGRSGVPFLGICLGMQLLTSYSDEGQVAGLGLVDVHTKSFSKGLPQKIPHMGWNSIQVIKSIPLLNGINEQDSFYFAHSYRVEEVEGEAIAAVTEYGDKFGSVINSGSVLGVQFHPEKSHDSGLKILQNFIDYY